MRFASFLALFTLATSGALAAPLNRPFSNGSYLGDSPNPLDFLPPPPSSSMTPPAASSTYSVTSTSISSRMTPPADYTRRRPSSTSALAAFSYSSPPVPAATADAALPTVNPTAQLAIGAFEHTDLRR